MNEHYIVFRFIQGFGNRLCNLMNMFYIHDKYPNALIYIDWIKNKHCNISIDEIFNFTEYDWILSSEEYYKNIFPKYKNIELWATTSMNERTRWDRIEEWQKHKCIVSVSFNLFEFVSKRYCINKFNSFIINKDIINMVNDKITKYMNNNKFIHFRNGDLIKILDINGYTKDVDKLMKKIDNLKDDYEIFEYNRLDVDRKKNNVIESIADLIYLSKHCNLVGYSPYSHFSSWIYLLSEKFIDDKDKYPIFNYKNVDIILLY